MLGGGFQRINATALGNGYTEESSEVRQENATSVERRKIIKPPSSTYSCGTVRLREN